MEVFDWFKRIVGRGRKAPVRVVRRVVRAGYDIADTTYENTRHWANADSLSADAILSIATRTTIRNRARYETANNSYAKGLCLTLAEYVVGTGPRLQLLTNNDDTNRLVEREFHKWARAVRLPQKLNTFRIAECIDGEGFALLVTNPRLPGPVQLDVQLVECDRVTSPFGVSLNEVDGIVYDGDGNPIKYVVLRDHPGDVSSVRAPGFEYDLRDVEFVLHSFKRLRPGQSRGVSEIAPALPLFALLRRYTLAVVSSAEQAACIGGVLKTNSSADVETAEVTALDEIDMNRNTWMTMPQGWDIQQLRSEQPTQVYSDFKRELVREVARALRVPFNVAAGDSSDSNYASGRLDYQAYHKLLAVDRNVLEMEVVDRIFNAWLAEAVLIDGYLPKSVRVAGDIPHQWFWDGLEHVDPLKEANAQAVKLENNVTTLAEEYARRGRDWEVELAQRAKEHKRIRELGLPDVMVAAPDVAEEEEPPRGAKARAVMGTGRNWNGSRIRSLALA